MLGSLLGFIAPFVVFFVFLSPLWWLLVIAACAAIIYELENEKGLIAGGVLVGTIAAMIFLGDTPIIPLIQENAWWTVVFVGGYFIAGMIWGVIRWTLYVDKKFAQYEDDKRQWLRNHGINEGKEIPEHLRNEFQVYLLDHPTYSYYITKKVKKDTDRYGRKNDNYYEDESRRVIQIRPLAWNNKARIGNWIGYWPWSLVWWAIDDAVRSIVRVIRSLIMDFLEAISIRKFRGTEMDYTFVPLKDRTVDGETKVEEKVDG